MKKNISESLKKIKCFMHIRECKCGSKTKMDFPNFDLLILSFYHNDDYVPEILEI